MLTLAIPLSVFSVFFVTSFKSVYDDKHQASVSRETTDLSLNMDSQLRSLSVYLSLLCQDATIRECVDNWSGNDRDAADLRDAINYNNFVAPRLINTDIAVLSPDGDFLYGLDVFRNVSKNEEFLYFVKDSRSTVNRGTAWFTDNQLSSDSGIIPEYCYVASAIRGNQYSRIHGYIVLRMRQSSLVSMYLVATNEHINFFVVDTNGNVIAYEDTMEVMELVTGEYNNAIVQGAGIIRAGAYTLYPIRLLNRWVLVSVSKTNTASAEMATMINTYLVAVAIAVISTLSVAYFISRKFVVPIDSLIVQMDNVSRGNLSSHVIIHSNDELEQLANHYNNMIDRLRNLIDQIVVEQEEKRKSLMLAYQAQINPHFLMNTISSIRYMIYKNDPTDIDRMILALTKILRYALSGTDEYATLNMELEQIRNYLTIQQFGFDTPLEYEINVDNTIANSMIIKLLLQPIVENAVLHGLKMQNKAPRLSVDVKPRGKDKIWITIEDNGIGCNPAELMKKIRTGKYDKIGLGNVYKRLLLHYENDFSFNIQSIPGKGTKVEIIIPRNDKKEVTS